MISRPAPSIDEPRKISILGATGSVGKNVAAVLRERRELFEVEALTASSRVADLAELAIELDATTAVIGRDELLAELRERLAGTGIECASGREAVVEAAQRPADMVMSAIVGAAGLEPTIAAARRGAMIGLANKECLVCAGGLLLAEVETHGSIVIPVDSEHSAMFQALEGSPRHSATGLTLTASGGPFRSRARSEMASASLADALAHPNWSMGAKISIDSATMMNKGLELIEAHYLFGMPEERIEIVIHPESIIHSLVSFSDGSTLAQMSRPDMRVPIAYALGWPDRIRIDMPALDLASLRGLTFEEPDAGRFPSLRLAREALRTGGAAPIVLNAANEVAVAAFVEGRIGFLDIASIVEAALDEIEGGPVTNLEEVHIYDKAGRRHARARVDRHACLEA